MTDLQAAIFSIEKATLADVPRLVAMINGCYRGEPSKDGWTTEAELIEGEIRTDEADLTSSIEKDNACILKCTHAEAGSVGSVYLEKKGDRLYLGMFSVDVAWQAAGIGKRLLAAAEAHARSLDCIAIFMQVIHLRNELIGWYERHGYHLTGERKPFDGDTKFGVPKVPLEFAVMEKEL